MATAAAVSTDGAALRAKAAAHARELELAAGAGQYLKVKHLAARWALSETTVRDIPASDLPFMEVGSGVRFRHRRYLVADVERYERARRVGGGPP